MFSMGNMYLLRSLVLVDFLEPQLSELPGAQRDGAVLHHAPPP